MSDEIACKFHTITVTHTEPKPDADTGTTVYSWTQHVLDDSGERGADRVLRDFIFANSNFVNSDIL